MIERITFCQGFCTCLNCDFTCVKQKDMVKHCKSKKHIGEITLTKTINYKE
jgi:hypothetical protein